MHHEETDLATQHASGGAKMMLILRSCALLRMIVHVYEYLWMGSQRDEQTDLAAQRDSRMDGQADERTDDEAQRGGLTVGRPNNCRRDCRETDGRILVRSETHGRIDRRASERTTKHKEAS